MITVELLSEGGRLAERVLIRPQPSGEWPRLVAWGSRYFINEAPGEPVPFYVEVRCLQVYTDREAKARGESP